MIEIGVRKIKIFISVVENESFSLAAKSLHLSQPAITIAINQIEEFFDQPLFIKTSNTVRKAKLTNKGLDIYSIFKDFMAEYDNMIDLVESNMSDKNKKINVYIDVNGMKCVNSLFFDLLKSQKIDDKIDIIVEKKAAIVEQLAFNRNSLGIILGDCNSENVDFLPIDTLPFGLISNTPIDPGSVWDKLHSETFFLANLDSTACTSVCNILKSQDVDLSCAVKVDDVSVFSELVSNGPFVGIAPNMPFDTERSQLHFTPLGERSLQIDFGVAVNKGRLSCNSVKGFISSLRDLSLNARTHSNEGLPGHAAA